MTCLVTVSQAISRSFCDQNAFPVENGDVVNPEEVKWREDMEPVGCGQKR
jgi:hypothetical protein